MTAITRDVVAT